MLFLTAHFTAEELGQPEGYGCPAQDYPSEWIESRAKPLCEQAEILRAELGGHPVTVTDSGGFRSHEYNEARIRAGHHDAEHSQHIEGRALDIIVAGVPANVVHDTALRLYREGKLQIGGLGRYPGFTHIDIRPLGPGEHLAQWEG
jgi:uncharacterized protein YcbK (DUF882 family)